MKVLVCFTGLVRTILETSENLKLNLFHKDYSVKLVFVTWDGENVNDFMKCFPEATIYTIPTISIDDELFLKWKGNSVIHHSWTRASKDIFIYYRQIFLWKQASIILEKYHDIDVFVRARTDVKLSGQLLHTYYEKVNESNIFFPNQPRHSIIGDVGCPDYFFIAKSLTFNYSLRIVDSINYLYNKYNIAIQPETTMHFHLLDKNIEKAIEKVKPENYKNYFDYAYKTKESLEYSKKSSTRKCKPKKYKE